MSILLASWPRLSQQGMARRLSSDRSRVSLHTLPTMGVATFAAPTATRLGSPIAPVARRMDTPYTTEGPRVDLTPLDAMETNFDPLTAAARSYPWSQPLYTRRDPLTNCVTLSRLSARLAKPLAVAYTLQSAVKGTAQVDGGGESHRTHRERKRAAVSPRPPRRHFVTVMYTHVWSGGRLRRRDAPRDVAGTKNDARGGRVLTDEPVRRDRAEVVAQHVLSRR